MNYPTITFLVFTMFTGIVYFIVPKKLQWTVLLAASAAFFTLACGSRIIFLLAACAIIYIAALMLQHFDDSFAAVKKNIEKSKRKALKKKVRRRKKAVLTIAVICVLSMLLGIKYFNFFGSLINDITGLFGQHQTIPFMKMLMPLGISYYTLMGIGYMTDVFRGTVKAEKNPFMLLLYLCYFPHITEGPFDNYKKLCSQFREPHYINYEMIKNGGIRFTWGLFKKFVIADRAGLIVNTIFADHGSFGGSALAFAVILYTIQLYAEFSGCMDMVCGVSNMFGIRISENFKRPFFSVSITDFWQRWHITLGQWLKNYVFYPVSLSEHFKRINESVRKKGWNEHITVFLPGAYALFFVWFINGMWHGASWKFIFYGLYYYILMMGGRIAAPLSDRVITSLNINRSSRPYHIFSILRTCIAVCFGMLIFRTESLTKAWDIFTSILTKQKISELFDGSILNGSTHLRDIVILAAAVFLLLAVSFVQEKGISIKAMLGKQKLPVRWLLYLCLLFSVIILGAYGGAYDNMSLIYGEF